MMLSSIMAHPAVVGGRGWCGYTMGSLHRIPSLPNNAENPRSRLLFLKNLFLAVPDVHCCMGFSLIAARGCLLAVVCRLLISVASPGAWASSGHGLSSFSSLAVESRLSSCGTGA